MMTTLVLDPRTGERAWTPSRQRVVSVMTRAPLTVAAEMDCASALGLVARRGVHRAPVTVGDELVGVACAFDLARAGAGATVADWMHAPAVTIHPMATLDDAADCMRECAIGCLPVVRSE